MRELVQAREQELATARSGVDFARDALVMAETARTLLTRRHDVLRGNGEEEWPRWLNETSTFMREVAEEQDFTLTNLGALRALELALGRRLAAPDLAEDMRRALMERVDALERHEALAEELINTRDQFPPGGHGTCHGSDRGFSPRPETARHLDGAADDSGDIIRIGIRETARELPAGRP